MNLGELGEAVAFDTAFWLEGTDDPDLPLPEMGRTCLELAEKFRTLAIICLLAKADSDLFYHHLMRAGLIRAKHLERVQRERAFDDHHFCSGRYKPLLDAIAAADLNLARRLTELSPREFREGHEYDDDYCYAQAVSRFIAEPARDGEVASFLDRFAAYAENQPNPRLAVSRALAARDQGAFDEAFDDLLHSHDIGIEEDKTRGQLEEPQIVAQRLVFIEGLAILRLAEHRGLRTEREYRYCPSNARVPMRTPFPGM
jgi:hypothetical protein